MITLSTYNCKTVRGCKAVVNNIATDGKGVVEYATGYAWDNNGKTPGPMAPCKWTADGKTVDRELAKFDLAEA